MYYNTVLHDNVDNIYNSHHHQNAVIGENAYTTTVVWPDGKKKVCEKSLRTNPDSNTMMMKIEKIKIE